MGVIKDGYYYPTPQEIFIGYQCEVNWNRGYEETFVPFVAKLKDENGIYLRDDIMELLIAMDDGYAECRVPVLSEENIESLGWKRGTGRRSNWWVIGDWSMRPVGGVFYGGYIEIMIGSSSRYFGQCPTINELRTLMRILEIK